MRIVQLAPLAESVPPKLYGGTERVIAWLVDELVDRRTGARGHPVRKRRLQHEGKAPPGVAARAAAGAEGRRSECRLRGADRSYRRTRARIRRDPLPSRLVATAGAEPDRRAFPDDDARRARPSRSIRCDRDLSGGPIRLHFQQPTPSASRGELDRNDSARAAQGSVSSLRRTGVVPGFPRTPDGGEGPEAARLRQIPRTARRTIGCPTTPKALPQFKYSDYN